MLSRNSEITGTLLCNTVYQVRSVAELLLHVRRRYSVFRFFIAFLISLLIQGIFLGVNCYSNNIMWDRNIHKLFAKSNVSMQISTNLDHCHLINAPIQQLIKQLDQSPLDCTARFSWLVAFGYSCRMPDNLLDIKVEIYTKMVYIGKTKRRLETRLKEHQDACRKCHTEKLAIAEHTCMDSNGGME